MRVDNIWRELKIHVGGVDTSIITPVLVQNTGGVPVYITKQATKPAESPDDGVNYPAILVNREFGPLGYVAGSTIYVRTLGDADGSASAIESVEGVGGGITSGEKDYIIDTLDELLQVTATQNARIGTIEGIVDHVNTYEEYLLMEEEKDITTVPSKVLLVRQPGSMSDPTKLVVDADSNITFKLVEKYAFGGALTFKNNSEQAKTATVSLYSSTRGANILTRSISIASRPGGPATYTENTLIIGNRLIDILQAEDVTEIRISADGTGLILREGNILLAG